MAEGPPSKKQRGAAKEDASDPIVLYFYKGEPYHVGKESNNIYDDIGGVIGTWDDVKNQPRIYQLTLATERGQVECYLVIAKKRKLQRKLATDQRKGYNHFKPLSPPDETAADAAPVRPKYEYQTIESEEMISDFHGSGEEIYAKCRHKISQGYNIEVYCCPPKQDITTLQAVVSVSSIPYAGCGLFAGHTYTKKTNQGLILPYFGDFVNEPTDYTMQKSRGSSKYVDGRNSKSCAWAANCNGRQRMLTVLNGTNNAEIQQGGNYLETYHFPKLTASSRINIGEEIFLSYGHGFSVSESDRYKITNKHVQLSISYLFERTDDIYANMQTKLCLTTTGEETERKIFEETLERISDDDIHTYKQNNGDDSYIVSQSGRNYKLLDRSGFGKTLLYCMNDARSRLQYNGAPQLKDKKQEQITCTIQIEDTDDKFGLATVSVPGFFNFTKEQTVELRWIYDTRATFVDAFTDLAI